MSRRHCAEKRRYLLLSAAGPLGRKIIRRVKYDEGLEMVAQRKAERVIDSAGGCLFQMLPPRAGAGQVFVIVPPVSSSSVFSRTEHEAIVGLRGPSETRGLSDAARKEREAAGLPGIDLIEAAQHKFEAYRAVH